jgi:hypothetical protein
VAISTKIPPYLKKKYETNGNVENFRGIIRPYVVVRYTTFILENPHGGENPTKLP